MSFANYLVLSKTESLNEMEENKSNIHGKWWSPESVSDARRESENILSKEIINTPQTIPKSQNINEEWENIVQAVKKVGYEVLGNKRNIDEDKD